MGSTPAMMEKAIASGISASATTVPADYSDLGTPLAGIATCQLALEQPLKALPDLEKALTFAQGRPGDPADRAAIELALSRALVATQREHPRAIDLAERARDTYRQAGRRTRAELADAESWLRQLTDPRAP